MANVKIIPFGLDLYFHKNQTTIITIFTFGKFSNTGGIAEWIPMITNPELK